MARSERANEIKRMIEEKYAQYTAASDAIWATPELFFHEDKSAKVLIELAQKEGFKVEVGMAGMPTAHIAKPEPGSVQSRPYACH